MKSVSTRLRTKNRLSNLVSSIHPSCYTCPIVLRCTSFDLTPSHSIHPTNPDLIPPHPISIPNLHHARTAPPIARPWNAPLITSPRPQNLVCTTFQLSFAAAPLQRRTGTQPQPTERRDRCCFSRWGGEVAPTPQSRSPSNPPVERQTRVKSRSQTSYPVDSTASGICPSSR